MAQAGWGPFPTRSWERPLEGTSPGTACPGASGAGQLLLLCTRSQQPLETNGQEAEAAKAETWEGVCEQPVDGSSREGKERSTSTHPQSQKPSPSSSDGGHGKPLPFALNLRADSARQCVLYTNTERLVFMPTNLFQEKSSRSITEKYFLTDQEIRCNNVRCPQCPRQVTQSVCKHYHMPTLQTGTLRHTQKPAARSWGDRSRKDISPLRRHREPQQQDGALSDGNPRGSTPRSHPRGPLSLRTLLFYWQMCGQGHVIQLRPVMGCSLTSRN